MLLTQLNDPNIFDDIQSKTIKISLHNCLIKPLLDLYIGEQFDAVRAKILDIKKNYENISLFVATHMHAGDGNVHTNIPVHSHRPDMLARTEKVVGKNYGHYQTTRWCYFR